MRLIILFIGEDECRYIECDSCISTILHVTYFIIKAYYYNQLNIFSYRLLEAYHCGKI